MIVFARAVLRHEISLGPRMEVELPLDLLNDFALGVVTETKGLLAIFEASFL